MSRTFTFASLRNGSLFRFPSPELVDRGQWMPPKRLDNGGVFLKVGNSHAIRVQAGMSPITVIPTLNTRVVAVNGVYDPRQHTDWWLVHGKEG